MVSNRLSLLLAASCAPLAISGAHAALQISSKPTQNMSCVAGVCTPTAPKAVLNVTDLANMLVGGDTTMQSGSVAQDIDIDAALSWTSTHRLTLDAYHSIAFNKPVTIAGTGALTITTNDGGSGGDFRFFGKGHVEFWDTSSSLAINGQNYQLAKSIKQINNLARHDGMYIALAASLNGGKHGPYTSIPIKQGTRVFEGLGNAISNVSISDSTGENDVSLFVDVGTLRDFGLVNFDISGTGTGQCIGALVALNRGAILHAYASGKISAGDNSTAGGLACSNQFGTITESEATVSISTGNNTIAGGLVGINETFCIVEDCTGLIDQAYSAGSITTGEQARAGGLVGHNYGGVISNSYSISTVNASSSGAVGGLIGSNENNEGESSDPKISASYSTGTVVGGSGTVVGGLIGSDTADPGIVDAYWDLDSSGIRNPHQGAGNIPDDPGITDLTDAQLKSGLPAGFDPKVWTIKPKINNGYPYLIDNPPSK